MKVRFNTYDIICGVTELQKLIGLRVNQVYDIDNKTYLIRFQHPKEKYVLLLESGIRFHTTAFEWPKNVAPSGFSMKLRKHLKNKRLESFQQLGVDRIVSLQFGSGEASYYVILELYDKGNIILTDHELIILNILRPHTENEEIKFAVKEKYPINRAKQFCDNLSDDQIKNILETAYPGDNLKKTLIRVLDCGPSVIEHVLLRYELADCIVKESIENTENQQNKKNHKQRKKENTMKCRIFNLEKDFDKLKSAIEDANEMIIKGRQSDSKGFIIQKKELKPSESEDTKEYLFHNIEYHPYLFLQYKDQPYKEFETFMAAVDEFYSALEGQKIDLKALQQEREALKKLSNVKKDHAKRLEELNKVQEEDKMKAELITRNQVIVDNAILAIRSAIANQMSWPDINELVKAAQANSDPVASIIKQLKLETNHIALYLRDPYTNDDEDDADNDDRLPSMVVDVDLGLSAFANARKYYDQKRTAAKKEQRTIDASEKALKSAEKKTQLALKDVRTISTISKARKIYWFEKFYWFISSENYLVIGGRDSQQNELIVKRYMKPTDIYVHAEIQGASSVIIKNPSGGDIPPKTLLEAGTMAICYSVAWDAKVVTNAYWVKSEQVSKTAPSGEYLGTGSFMIRGKKNFLPPCHLIMGLSLLFKLEDSSVERHKGERRVKTIDDKQGEALEQLLRENEKLEDIAEEEEIQIEDDADKEGASDKESSSENEEQNTNFPDTRIKIEHDTGKVTIHGNVKEDTINEDEKEETENNISVPVAVEEKGDTEQLYIIPALPPRKKQQTNMKKKKKNKHESESKQKVEIQEENKKGSQIKRGQKGKLKKIKSKYKDQDEEERQLRMQILQSAGTDKHKEESKDPQTENSENRKQSKSFSKQNQQEIDDVDDAVVNADVDMLDSLTGCPVDEDEILFAIPVVAPYQALQNYKFKVKLTPGTGKRGKAAKTALLMFTKDKACTSREKDLLKGIKEESLARNIPGKVKLSAPQLQKLKGK